MAKTYLASKSGLRRLAETVWVSLKESKSINNNEGCYL